ncbi:hypothetical protein CY34DRAFT_808467 [Suillus luteus UH-Slu-Lm8-n1]|uniref:Uncharacterized protein n=1 Tax=Suillus luteus UH-Slu-Lm8-n1 TaxID=930992 RepID=A0A0D0AMH8_9AGAM|nr:hypothetical protein CY34DRAFT_808467 [Suillus luteus UH-Slu-Lm8-n1]
MSSPIGFMEYSVELEWKQNLKPHLRRDDRAHDNLLYEYFNFLHMASLRISAQLQLRS